MKLSSVPFLAAATPPSGGGGAAYLGEAHTAGFGTINATMPSGLTAADTVTAICWSTSSGAPASMSAPSGWTAGTGVTNPAEGRGARFFTAPGDVATSTFTGTNLTNVLIFATSAPLRNAELHSRDYSGGTPSGGSGANQPTPAVTAVADDLGVSAYIQYDDGAAGALNSPGSPQASYTREYFKNDAAPWLSVLSRAGLSAGSTGTVSHDANGGFSGRFLFTGTYGA